MTAIVWPSYSNDDGTYTTGTIADAAFMDSIESGINTLVHSTTNPTVTPVNIIDEVVRSRFALADLDTFLGLEHNTDGTHNLSDAVVTSSILADSMHGVNLLADPTFMCWPQGDALAPAWWVIEGQTSIDRAGTGQADTRRKIGEFCAKLERGATNTEIRQEVWKSTDHAVLDGFEGTVVGAGGWLWTSTTNTVRVFIDDGAAKSYSGYPTASTWTWVSVTRTIAASATFLMVGVEMAGSVNDIVYVSGMTAVFSDTAPGQFIPGLSVIGTLNFYFKGQPVVEDGARHAVFARPGIIKAVSVFCGTEPTTGGGIDWDLEIDNGAAWQRVFSGTQTSPLVNKQIGYSEPNGTYQYRCFQGHHTDDDDTSATEDQMIRLNIDDAAVARDVTFQIRILQWLRPLEDMLAANSIPVG